MNSKWLSGKGRCAGLGGDDGDDNGNGGGDFDDDDDKLARDPSINRNFGTAPSLRTEQMDSKWLNGKGRCSGLDGDGKGEGCADLDGCGGGEFDGDDKRATDTYGHRRRIDQWTLLTDCFCLPFSEPNFVSTYEFGNFVYFFFREIAVEYINCGKVSVRARVYTCACVVCVNV